MQQEDRKYVASIDAHLLLIMATFTNFQDLLTRIFVAIPKIAQQRINDAKLTIQGIQMSQTQAENFTLSINSTIEADSSISAVIDPFEGVMYLEDWAPQTPFARIQFPQTTSASQTIVNITQFTEILDMEAFTVFNTWTLVNETINVSVEGDTHLKVSGISKKYPVHFKKTVNMPALSNFNGTTVPTSRVQLTADAQGDNFFGNVIIPNRSFITFEIVCRSPLSLFNWFFRHFDRETLADVLGNILFLRLTHLLIPFLSIQGNTSFINFLLNENVGTVFIDNMTLRPGDNNLTLRANISTAPVLTDIQKAPYCETGILPFQLQGLNVSNHGQYLSYFALALASTNQSVSIDVGADLEDLGLNITCSSSSSKRMAGSESTSLW